MKSDWEKLREEFIEKNIKPVTMLATLPKREPSRSISDVCDGIYPIWNFQKEPK